MQNNPLEIIKSSIEDACENKASIDIEAIIRNIGLVLDKKADLHPDIAGQIELLSDKETYKISVNRNDHYYRQRFTMAHELGHYLFHSSLLGEGIEDSKAYRSAPLGKFKNCNIDAHHETQANKFAADMLMPSKLIKCLAEEMNINLSDVSSEQMKELATKLKVSTRALAIRLGAK